MEKRIYMSFLTLILIYVLLLSTLVGLIFYNLLKKREIDFFKSNIMFVSKLLNEFTPHEDERDYNDIVLYVRFADYSELYKDSARMEIIRPDGSVLLNSSIPPRTLESYNNSYEVMTAIETGSGEATRFSKPLRSNIYYYAVLLNDGNILHMSKIMNDIYWIFIVVPVVLIATTVVLLFTRNVVRRLTFDIVKSLNDIDFESNNMVTYDEFLPYFKKLNKQKREIKQQMMLLKNRADTIDIITENMQEGLIIIDRDGIILTANKSILKIFQEESMVEKRILHICRDTEFHRRIKKCLSGINTEMPFKKGNKIYNIYFNPVYNNDEINGATIFFFDTTDKYESEKQRREFSANVSHELKTPLTTISALSEMLENGMAKEEDIKNFASKISGQSKWLINIIDDIIRLSEFDEEKIQKEGSIFDIYRLADSVITTLSERARKKNVRLELTGEHMEILANMRMIDELLYNLIDNGINYNKEGGQVTITISSVDNFCKISISDTGIGITKEHEKHIFERFYRVDKSRSKKTGGTGLGLSIVKHIVEYHKGRIEVESFEGIGTTIICYIKVQNKNNKANRRFASKQI